MSVQLPPVGDPLEERLASLEDPAFAARLFNENPSLYAKTLAQIQKQARQRRLWTASLAGTAIVSLTAGLFMGPTISKLLSPPAAQKHTVAAAPMRSIPAREPARVEQRTSPVAPPARRGVAVHHPARGEKSPVTPVVNEAAIRANSAARAEMRRLEARIAAEEAAAKRAQAEARAAALAAAQTYRQVQVHAAAAPAVRPVPAAAPAGGPSSAAQSSTTTQGATTTQSTTTTQNGPSTTASTGAPATTPQSFPDPPLPSGGTKGVPGGGWTEHYPMGGGGGPVLIGRDPCTPPGGRIGTVIQGVLRAGIAGGAIRF